MSNIVRIIVLSEIVDIRIRREHRIHLRHLRDNSDPFQLPNFVFQKFFRLDKVGVKILIGKLEPHARKTSIPFTLRFLSALHFFAQGSYQVSVGSCHTLALSQPSVSRAIKEVTALINDHLLGDLIKFPGDPIKVAETKERFFSKFGMQGIIGVVDGCHIAIVAPPEDDPEFTGNLFRNRKGYHSLNTLVCCDADMRIIYGNARFPGSVHDSAIWMTSQLRRNCIEKYTSASNQSSYLLGDSGFPLEPWLLTPFTNRQQGSREYRYDEVFVRTRLVIEKCFGLLKSRFRCLLRHRTLHYHPTTACRIIYAVFALHNYCIDRKNIIEEGNCDDLEDTDEFAIVEEHTGNEGETHNTPGNSWFPAGKRVREMYVDKHFS